MAKITRDEYRKKVRIAMFLVLVFICSIVYSLLKLKDLFLVQKAQVVIQHVATTTVPVQKVTHVTVPKSVKALYMSAWVASGSTTRQKVINLIDKTSANAVVIDIKDYTGKISFIPTTESIVAEGCYEDKIKDIDAFIEELHKKDIYVIGRLAVFQDPCMVKGHPEDSVKNVKGGVWHDKKGITWLDASNHGSWQYFADIAKESYDRGFDEINLDYIRFPTDGDMAAMRFSGLASSSKSFAIRDFFKFMDSNLRSGLGNNYTMPAPNATSTPFASSTLDSKVYNIKEFEASKNRLMLSADVFGLVTEAVDDMGIGQHFEYVLPYVDFLSPMVYPSHYASGYNGFKNPAAEPYKVILSSMGKAVDRAKKIGQDPLKLRPWLQDFDLGATYTPAMVESQIKANYEVGLQGFLLWDPANKYKGGSVALDKPASVPW